MASSSRPLQERMSHNFFSPVRNTIFAKLCEKARPALRRLRMRPFALGLIIGALTLFQPLYGEDQNQEREPSGEEIQAEWSPDCRKLATDDALPVEKGHWELEWSNTFSFATEKFDGGNRARRKRFQEFVSEVSITYGLLDRMDIGVSLGIANLLDRECEPHEGTGLTDLSIGAKWQFYADEEKRVWVAYLPAITAPIGTEATRHHLGTSDEFWTFENKVALTKEINDRWTTNFALGYALPFGGNREQEGGTFTTDIALGYQPARWLQIEAEINYAHDVVESAGDSDTLAITGGLIIPVSDRVCFTLGVQQVVAGRETDISTAGIFSIVVGL